MTTKTIGENGFRWFIGKVVEREKDPLKLGRVKVRVYSLHDNESQIPNDKLPWATPLTPPYSAANQGVGISPLGLMVGSIVFGFFMDGNEGQLPIILGSLAGIPDDVGNLEKHDVAKLAREENDLLETKNKTRVEGQLVSEPESPYKAKYPFNKVIKTERGHVIELDDTEGQERLHFYHRTGTFTEIDKDGTQVNKIVGNNYSVTVKDNNTLVGGDCFVEVQGKVIVVVNGTASVRVDGECSMSAGGNFTISSDTKLILTAPEIHLNPDVTTTAITSPADPTPTPTIKGKSKYAGFIQPNIKKSRWGG